MSVMNVVSERFPDEVKDEFTIPRKRNGFLRIGRSQNFPVKKYRVSKGCHNCSYYLSKYYYWKQSPCDNCSQSPMFYYSTARMNLPNQWKAKTPSSDLKKNILRS